MRKNAFIRGAAKCSDRDVLFETDGCSLLNRQPKLQPVKFFSEKGVEIGIRIDPEQRRKYMAHNHGYEYQIKIIRKDGVEELSGWMNDTERLAQAMIAVHQPQGKTFWLLVRNIICSNCPDGEQISEYPIVDIPSPRCIHHDSRYLRVVDSESQYTLSFSASRRTA
jgi:hypothetical protein